MPNIKKVGLVSAAFLLAQMILSKLIYPIIGKTTQTMFAISDINPGTGIGGTKIGDTLLGYITGYVPFDITNYSVWIAMFIGVFALTFIGMWMYEQKYVRLWQGKNITQRLFAILVYSHVVLYLLFLALKWSIPGIALNLLIGVAINLLLVSVLVTISADKLNFPKV